MKWILVAFVLAVSACSVTNDAGPAPTSTAGESAGRADMVPTSTTTPATTPADTPEGQRGDPDATNLADFFGWNEGIDVATARIREREMRREELLVACMALEGFTYHPKVYTDDDYVGLYDTGVELASRVGYGIVGGYVTPDRQWVDPNQEQLIAMSRAEEQAWYDALWGSQAEQEAADDNAGCIGEMEQTLAEEWDTSGWVAITPDAEAMHQAILADPRVIEAERGWTACMAEAGHTATTIVDWERRMRDHFGSEVQALLGSVQMEPDPDEIASIIDEEGSAAANRFQNEYVAASLEPLAPDFRALQAQEIEIAVVDHGCREPYTEAYRSAQLEAEERFIDEHRVELTQILESRE